jgi:hypothetical protein
MEPARNWSAYDNLTDASPIDFDSKDLNLTTEDWLDLFYRDDDLRWLDLRSYRFHPFDVQAAVILYLRNLQKVKLLSVVQSGNEHGSLHALWKADPDESVNRDFMRTAVSIGMDKSLWTLSQFARIFNPGAPQYQEIFYFGYVMSK